ALDQPDKIPRARPRTLLGAARGNGRALEETRDVTNIGEAHSDVVWGLAQDHVAADDRRYAEPFDREDGVEQILQARGVVHAPWIAIARPRSNQHFPIDCGLYERFRTGFFRSLIFLIDETQIVDLEREQQAHQTVVDRSQGLARLRGVAVQQCAQRDGLRLRYPVQRFESGWPVLESEQRVRAPEHRGGRRRVEVPGRDACVPRSRYSAGSVGGAARMDSRARARRSSSPLRPGGRVQPTRR